MKIMKIIRKKGNKSKPVVKEFNEKILNELIVNNLSQTMEKEWFEREEEENKQNWLANLREEIKQDSYDTENSLRISSNNHESDEFQNESIDFSEEGVYESALGFCEHMAEYQYEQSLINCEEQEKEWTLSEEDWEEILLQREYEALSEIYESMGNDKEFLEEISRNDEFNERNTPFFIS